MVEGTAVQRLLHASQQYLMVSVDGKDENDKFEARAYSHIVCDAAVLLLE